MFPTNYKQILVDSIVKILQYSAIVAFVSLCRLFVIPVSGLNTKNLVPMSWFDKAFLANSLPLMVSLQTCNVGRGIFSESQNKFAVRKSLVQFPIDYKPWPIFKRFKFRGLFQHWL